jgi:CDGSH-type Zn-finger protein/uncharacterized Fe-S cluster protein YjdI
VERLGQLSEYADAIDTRNNRRLERAASQLRDMARRAGDSFGSANVLDPAIVIPVGPAHSTPPPAPLASQNVDGVETVEGEKVFLQFEGKRCIHARHCVTGAPGVFLANVQGDWIYPDAIDIERLVEIAHACPSGAIRYRRKDGREDEQAPKVNLISVREAGPYAVRGDLSIEGIAIGMRATFCRCGASKNKPFFDGSHQSASFLASGEPPSTETAMLPVRDGPLEIRPEVDGPLQVRGNLEIVSGTGRVVARVETARLCRCGGSESKPFCDGSHARIGFRS